MLRVSTFYCSDVAHVNMVARKFEWSTVDESNVARVNTERYNRFAHNAKTKAVPSRTLARDLVASGNSVDRRSRAGWLYLAGGSTTRKRFSQRPLPALS